MILHRSIFSEFGCTLDASSVILDFGSGDGQLVQEYRHAGLQAFGADVTLSQPNEWVRQISTDEKGYRLPFPDAAFDFLVSNSVLEHVEDLDAALSEMYRVLKPGGATLHFFPPPSRPIEPHVFVPLGGLLRSYPWLLLWAALGVRNSFQKGLAAAPTAQSNYDYLRSRTFYRSKVVLRRQIGYRFTDVTFADAQLIKHSYGKARMLAPLIAPLPVVASWYGSLHQRCLFFRKPRVSS